MRPQRGVRRVPGTVRCRHGRPDTKPAWEASRRLYEGDSGALPRTVPSMPDGPGVHRRMRAARPLPVSAKRLRTERPNHVWSLDFQFDATSDGRTLKLLHVV